MASRRRVEQHRAQRPWPCESDVDVLLSRSFFGVGRERFGSRRHQEVQRYSDRISSPSTSAERVNVQCRL